nr:M64 family metallopeptidase [Prolixibacteraceae bacterium]
MKNRAFFLLSFVLFVACQTSRAKDEKRQDKAVPNVIAVNQGDVDFSDYFLDKTMRVDYIHTGNAEKEIFAIDQVVNDGVWPGSQTVLIDHLELGLYFFEVLDAETHILLYSRGFASIFGEWQTLPEASEEWGSFHESVRFPWPLKPVSLIIKKRNAHNKFQPIWSTVIDPSNRQVNKAERIHSEKVHAIVENGPAHEKLDIVVLGDGYHVSEMEKFGRDAKRLSQALLQTEPFNEHRNNINIRAVETPAAQSGVNKPHHGVFKHTPLSVSYSAFDSERYALTYDNRSVRNIASAVPYDFMVILINEKTYGGGGIYNLYTTVATDNLFSEYIMIHEMGHHMAALADEYYTSAVAYEIPEITVEPWETNVTALLDKDNLKWKDLVDEDMPIPSP